MLPLLRTCLPLVIAAALCLPTGAANAQQPPKPVAEPAPAPKPKHGPTPPPIACCSSSNSRRVPLPVANFSNGTTGCDGNCFITYSWDAPSGADVETTVYEVLRTDFSPDFCHS